MGTIVQSGSGQARAILKKPRGTSPILDTLFLKLEHLTIENCFKSSNCRQCELLKKCYDWHDGVSERSASHKLTLTEFNKALERFNNL
jgi:hypothetical protein